jgi:hypothetical protein
MRGPNHPKDKDRKICPFPTMQDECDEKRVDCEDSKIVRLEADESFEASYTFFDVRFMRDGGTYWMGSRKCCWLCIDGVGQNLTLKEMRELLGKRRFLE